VITLLLEMAGDLVLVQIQRWLPVSHIAVSFTIITSIILWIQYFRHEFNFTIQLSMVAGDYGGQ
jgi:hypothetical protein